MSNRALPLALPVVALVGLLASCATPSDPASPGGGSMPDVEPVAVVGQGTVIQVGDEAPQFCLGAVAESYPPQCTGPGLVGWDWSAVEGEESASGTTWGTYAVWGLWNGTVLAVDSAIQLALYDPMPVEDPALDPANAGASSEDELLAIQSEIADESPVEVLSSWTANGYLFVQVLSEDAAVQEWADDRYGPGVVEVRPALRPVE